MNSNPQVQELLQRATRSIRRCRMVRAGMFWGLIYSLLLHHYFGGPFAGGVVLVVVFAGWIGLSAQSRAKAALTSRASQLIGAGQLSQAREVLGQTFRGLCVHKPVLLMACHNLAVILQKQGQWLGSWQLCELVRNWAGRGAAEIRVVSEAVRADCGLAMNNLAGTYESLTILSGMNLSVTERLSILQAEIIYAIRVGRSDTVMADLPDKVNLAKLLPTEQAGVVHAWLALAAYQAGQRARRDWLWRRATLYRPAKELLACQPGLEGLGRAVSAADSGACKNTQGRIES